MDQTERDSSKPRSGESAEDASQEKALRGNHSRPLDESRKASRPKKADEPSAPKHGAHHGEDASDSSESPKPAEDGAKASSSKASDAKASEEKGSDAKASHGKSPDDKAADAKAPAEKRTFIIPDEMLEPPTMVDTSANKQQVKQRQVFHENPNIYYMNGESLSRPMTLPPTAKAGIVVIIVIAAILASAVFYLYFDTTTNEPARERARMEEQLNRNVNLDLPDMLSLLELDDATIDAQMKGTGDTYFDRSAVGSGEDYEIVKLPPDITVADAAAMYATGLSKLTPSQAASLLNGAWDLKIDRSNGLDMALHYADFKSGNEETAIENAISAEDLGRGTKTDSGDNDGYGNHYTMGTIMINGKIYDWTVSATELKDVYPIAGLPDNAVYVGIRIKGSNEA